MTEPGGEDMRVQLASIKGGVDLINERLKAANEKSDERHERTQTDIQGLREKIHDHANALQVLFGWKSSVEGERKGLAAGGKLLWSAVGLIPGGAIVAALMKLFAI